MKFSGTLIRLDIEGLLESEAELGLFAAEICASGVPLRLCPAEDDSCPTRVCSARHYSLTS